MTRLSIQSLKVFSARMLAPVATMMCIAAASCEKHEAKTASLPRVILISDAPKPPVPPVEKKIPVPEPEKKQPMIVEMAVASPKPVQTKQKADEPGPIELGKGPGDGKFGPGGSGDGNGTGPVAEPEVVGSPFGWYAGQVQTTITAALRQNPKTRNASFRVRVAIWVDSTGRVTKAKLIGTTGSQGLDQTIRSEIFPGIQLTEAPPATMPMPIQLRLNVIKQG